MQVNCLRGGMVGLTLCIMAGDLSAADPRKPSSHVERRAAALSRFVVSRQVEAQWRGVPLRTVLKELDALHQIPIVLDRRIDPSIEIEYAGQGESLGEIIGQFASRANAGVGSGPRCLYLGPPQRAEFLQTLIESQTAKLKLFKKEEDARSVWHAERNVQWSDLATPREILEQLEHTWSVTIRPLEELPHDRWAGVDLRKTTLTQALAVVLIQLDCGWNWEQQSEKSSATGHELQVVIVPLTTNPTAQRTWELKTSVDVQAMRERLPQLELLSSGSTLVATGKSEDLDLLDRLVRGGEPPERVVRPVGKVPLSRRRITITVKDVTVMAVIDQLANEGTAFEYDQSQLTAAGVNLDQIVEFSLKQATLDELLEELFSGQPVRWDIGKESIVLEPTR